MNGLKGESMIIQELFEEIDSDLKEVLIRFGNNEGLLERFVRKFPEDKTFSQIQASVSAGDYHEIEQAAHTMKGLAANLGFKQLSKISAAVVSEVREGRYEMIAPLFQELTVEYDKITGCICKLN